MTTQLKIHPDFERYLAPLDAEELKLLEEDILVNGVRESIKTWQGYIIDGHHRYRIAKKFFQEIKVEELDFQDEGEVIEWMASNQLGRRNVTPATFTLLLGELYESRRAKGEAKLTAEEIAEEYGVSERTVRRGIQVRRGLAEIGDEDLEEALKQGRATQKEVLEKIKQRDRDAQAPSYKNGFTEAVEKLAHQLDGAISRVRTTAAALDALFSQHDQILRTFAPEIAAFHTKLEPEQREAYKLKSLYVCPADSHKDCDCFGSGYVDSVTFDQMVERLKKNSEV